MLFYADNYIKNTLHSDIAILSKPSHSDTVFINRLVAKANSDYKKAFAARQPVQLISKSPLVSVTKRQTEPTMENSFDTSNDYLDPTFDIAINKAYRNFHYSFSVYIDEKGNMYYRIPLVGFYEHNFKVTFIKESTAIMNTYLKYYLNITPGSTLGMRHSSIISLHVNGIQ
jgi:hypothetical protein